MFLSLLFQNSFETQVSWISERETPSGKQQDKDGCERQQEERGLVEEKTSGYYHAKKVPKNITRCTRQPEAFHLTVIHLITNTFSAGFTSSCWSLSCECGCVIVTQWEWVRDWWWWMKPNPEIIRQKLFITEVKQTWWDHVYELIQTSVSHKSNVFTEISSF